MEDCFQVTQMGKPPLQGLHSDLELLEDGMKLPDNFYNVVSVIPTKFHPMPLGSEERAMRREKGTQDPHKDSQI